jgi:hypothetical protein
MVEFSISQAVECNIASGTSVTIFLSSMYTIFDAVYYHTLNCRLILFQCILHEIRM